MCELLSCVQLCVTLWTVAHQASLSLKFSRQEYWSGLPFPSPCVRCMLILFHVTDNCPQECIHKRWFVGTHCYSLQRIFHMYAHIQAIHSVPSHTCSVTKVLPVPATASLSTEFSPRFYLPVSMLHVISSSLQLILYISKSWLDKVLKNKSI